MRFRVLAVWGGLAAVMPAAALSAAPKPPVVVEFYTSQGCGACAEAGAVVDRLADRTGILPLTFNVDSWDYLGWPDTFARKEFTDRQRTCADNRFKGQVYVPQLIVAGRAQARAAEAEAVDRMVRRAQNASPSGPPLRFAADKAQVGIGAGPRQSRAADVWLLRYDPSVRTVDIRRGENQGRTVSYRNVVRELVRLGDWNGKPKAFDIPATRRERLTTVIMVQRANCGEVIALASPPPAPLAAR